MRRPSVPSRLRDGQNALLNVRSLRRTVGRPWAGRDCRLPGEDTLAWHTGPALRGTSVARLTEHIVGLRRSEHQRHDPPRIAGHRPRSPVAGDLPCPTGRIRVLHRPHREATQPIHVLARTSRRSQGGDVRVSSVGDPRPLPRLRRRLAVSVLSRVVHTVPLRPVSTASGTRGRGDRFTALTASVAVGLQASNRVVRIGHAPVDPPSVRAFVQVSAVFGGGGGMRTHETPCDAYQFSRT